MSPKGDDFQEMGGQFGSSIPPFQATGRKMTGNNYDNRGNRVLDKKEPWHNLTANGGGAGGQGTGAGRNEHHKSSSMNTERGSNVKN